MSRGLEGARGRVLLWLLAGFFGFALAQTPDEGYAEGRIVGADHELRVAVVRLAGGDVVQAELGAAAGATGLPEFQAGERVELYYQRDQGGARRYLVSDWVRRPSLYWLVGLFLVVAVVVARAKGLRAFISTACSLAIAVGFVVPGILAGYSPVLVSLLGVGTILVLAIYFVHGVSWSTTAALVGTFAAVVVTMAIGLYFVDLARLTGFGSHEAIYINLAAAQVNLKGMILAGLLIGALGALTDITIVQASVVRELAPANPRFGMRALYARAMNVGLDHIGSLVNTLVLAYTGAALPLLVLLRLQATSLPQALNVEPVAVEVVHTLVGSIGLILAVPLTTFIAAFLFRGDRLPLRPGELEHAHHH
jgi:uncharacterized membrane protein